MHGILMPRCAQPQSSAHFLFDSAAQLRAPLFFRYAVAPRHRAAATRGARRLDWGLARVRPDGPRQSTWDDLGLCQPNGVGGGRHLSREVALNRRGARLRAGGGARVASVATVKKLSARRKKPVLGRLVPRVSRRFACRPDSEARVLKLKFALPPSALNPAATAIASTSVELPLPFSPTKKVTFGSKSIARHQITPPITTTCACKPKAAGALRFAPGAAVDVCHDSMLSAASLL